MCDIYSRVFHIPIYTTPKEAPNKKYDIPPVICQLAKIETDFAYWKKEFYPNYPYLSPKERTHILNKILKKDWNTILKKDRLAIFFSPI